MKCQNCNIEHNDEVEMVQVVVADGEMVLCPDCYKAIEPILNEMENEHLNKE